MESLIVTDPNKGGETADKPQPREPSGAERRSAAILTLMATRTKMHSKDLTLLSSVFDVDPFQTLIAQDPKADGETQPGTVADALCRIPLAYWTSTDTLNALDNLPTTQPVVRVALYHLHLDPLEPAGKTPGALLLACAKAAAISEADPADIYAETREVLAYFASTAAPMVWDQIERDLSEEGLDVDEIERVKSTLNEGHFAKIPPVTTSSVQALMALAGVRARLNGTNIIATADCEAFFDPDTPISIPVGPNSAFAARFERRETLFALVHDKMTDSVVLSHFTEDCECWLGPRFSNETAARVFAMFEYGIPEDGWSTSPEPS